MPLVKKSNGWFWGLKGPFTSKSKALSVARAAYAHGYKEEGTRLVGDNGKHEGLGTVRMAESAKTQP
jgi:hypothetical protein